MKAIILITMIVTFFPYMMPLSMQTDIQPLYLLLIILSIAIKVWSTGALKVEMSTIAIAIFGTISLLHLGKDLALPTASEFGLLAGCLAFLFYSNFKNYIKSIHLAALLIIAYFGVVLQFVYPASFDGLIEYLMPFNRYQPGTVRGFTSFTPEPIFMSGLAFMIGVTAMYLRDWDRISVLGCLLTLCACLVLMALSLSISAIIFAFITIGYIYRLKKIYALYVIVICSIMPLILDNGTNSTRVETVFSKGYAQIILDQSISQRLSNINTALFTLSTQPLGYGSGSFEDVSQAALKREYITTNPEIRPGLIVSSISKSVVENSYIAVITILFIFLSRLRAVRIENLIGAFFMVLASFPWAHPAIWLLLALDGKKPRGKQIVKVSNMK